MKKQQNLIFFILGAPKCGTTAMSEYARTHPDICFSEPKEPNYFNTDFSKEYRGWANQKDYKDCFNCNKENKLLGEGTVWYLYSKKAVEDILKFNPKSKFIVMARNPVDMVYSYHHQIYKTLHENISDFKTAWNLQEERIKGKYIPNTCKDKKLLQYGDICKLGRQLRRLYKKAPKDQVHVIIFDDFVKDTRDEYLKLLNFLGLEDDGRTEFPRINPNQEVNRTWKLGIRRFGELVYPKIKSASEKLKTSIGVKDWGILKCLQSLGEKQVEREPLDPVFCEELKDYFRKDVELLSELLDRDLTYWVEPDPIESTGEAK